MFEGIESFPMAQSQSITAMYARKGSESPGPQEQVRIKAFSIKLRDA
jgi:hypothetical protein